MSTVCPLLGYPDIRLAISLSSASSFHVNLLLMACTATLLYDTVLWVLQLLFSTKASDFTLSYCAGTKVWKSSSLASSRDHTLRYNLHSRASLGSRLRLDFVITHWFGFLSCFLYFLVFHGSASTISTCIWILISWSASGQSELRPNIVICNTENDSWSSFLFLMCDDIHELE